MSSETQLVFNCTECNKFFKNERRLDMHNRVVHQGLKLTCELCDKKFINNSTFYNHIKFEHKEAKGLFRCQKCDNSYNHPSNLNQHKLTVHEGRRLQCDLCGQSFTLSNAVRRHKRNIHGIRDFYCEICGEVCTKISQLKKHKKNVHGEKHLAKSKIRGLNRICKYCNISYYQHNNLISTEMENSGKIQIQDGASELILQCCFCYKKKFSRVLKLRMHILRIHKTPKDFKCEYCEKSFPSVRNLKLHIQIIHKGRKIHGCRACGQSFSQQGPLKNHIRSFHDGYKNYKCDSCGESFSEPGNLKKHISTMHEQHEQHKEYKCDFVTSHLTIHQFGVTTDTKFI